jgi:pyruvate dehydrogenase E1 component
MTDLPKLEDLDPVETQEWLESIDSVLKLHGPERAHFILERLIDYTRRSGAYLPFKPNTAYVNNNPTRGTARSSDASRRTSAGMRWRWWCRRT